MGEFLSVTTNIQDFQYVPQLSQNAFLLLALLGPSKTTSELKHTEARKTRTSAQILHLTNVQIVSIFRTSQERFSLLMIFN